MHYATLVPHLRLKAPLSDEQAEKALLATLRGLASLLPGASARTLAGALGFTLESDASDSAAASGPVAAVTSALEVPATRAREYVQVACAALAEKLDDTLLERLRRELPDDLVEMLRPAARPPSARHTPVGHGTSLADGKPGSRRPISESAPGSTHAVSESAPPAHQEHSVAEPNPHGDTKVSSATD